MGYARSRFRGYESYLRIVFGLDEDIFNWFWNNFSSSFVTYEIPPGIYSTEDILDAVYTMGDPEGTLEIEYDEITMKAKFILTRFEGTLGVLRLDANLSLVLF